MSSLRAARIAENPSGASTSAAMKTPPIGSGINAASSSKLMWGASPSATSTTATSEITSSTIERVGPPVVGTLG
ncbi:MAG: hypothetical protein DWH96_05470 [Planctomycetota bacterium]|nr:MAG: hypothetical protein DWH96_05470 [Planctomycetota bacterium]RLS94947.1 MAG: hypothetical protein DWI11_03740 [Planctomycetota bacterium]